MATRKLKTKKTVEIPQPAPWFAVKSSQVDDTIKITITKFPSLEAATANRRTPKVVIKGEHLEATVKGFLPAV